MRVMLVAAALLALAGCEATGPQGTGGIDEVHSRFETASTAGDAALLASLYTADAAVMAPNLARIDGRPGIEAMWARFFDAGTTRITMTPSEVDVQGARATDVGTFALTGRDGQGGTVTLTGKYINIWRNNDAGGWQLHRGIWNYDPPG